MRRLVAFAAGLLFGAGLLFSGMIQPAKVLNFLDLAGAWDPSLALVMGGALLVTFAGYRLAFARRQPLCDSRFHLPGKRALDARLVGGAALFGLGWGLGGYCPGPALAALAGPAEGTLAFIAAMIAGMILARLASPADAPAAAPPASPANGAQP